MKIKLLSLLVFITILGCKKEGPGGTSSINGVVMSVNHENARDEITEIICTNGLQVEHGDYWLLNSPDQSQYYYVWYDNPTWITNGDPQLSGRIGISVGFNYSDSNTDIADSTANALGLYTNSNFTIEVINDVIRISNKNMGYVPDADEVTSPFEFNIVQQGKDASSLPSAPLVDEKVYLVYGESEYANDDVRTGINGEFQFTGLAKGNYSVYTMSKDTINGGLEKVEVDVVISGNKSVKNVGTINVVN